MKIEAERSNFLKAWQTAEKYTASKTNNNALNGIRITATQNTVTLEATDIKSSVKCTVKAANVDESGVAVLNAVVLGDMLRKTTEQTIILEVNDNKGILKAGKSKSRFPAIPAESFPNIPESSGAEPVCTIMAADLARVINEGSCAASAPSDFPRYMGTCLLKTEGNNIIVVSTDGKRLARSKTLCMSINREDELLMPAAAMKETAKNFTGEDTVKILADGSTVWFVLEKKESIKEKPETSTDNSNNPEGNSDSESTAENSTERVEISEFSMQRIEASFPKYERILNNEVSVTLKISKSVLLPALERIDIIAKNSPAHIMAVYLNPNPENDEPPLRITARAPEHGTTSESMNAHIEGEHMQIGFNAAYFIEGLKAADSDDITIEFSSDEGQTRILKDEGENFLYMLMPIRLTPQDIVTDDDSADFSAPAEPDDLSDDDDDFPDDDSADTEEFSHNEDSPQNDSDVPF